MDLDKDYEKLFQHWLEEFQQTDLTELSSDLLMYFKNTLNSINEYFLENKNELKERLLKSYRENINFLFKDFLKIREIKIINSALAMKEINLGNLIEAEKLLYQNLVSSIKGYKKVKKLSLFDEEIEANLKKSYETVLETKDSIEEIPILDKQDVLRNLDLQAAAENENIEYVLVRFIKKTPPLVGIDLINYGPFEKEDIVNMPQKNAKILIIEKFAEKIELP
jgi:DNA replication initiation complex subunit (GINS family)